MPVLHAVLVAVALSGLVEVPAKEDSGATKNTVSNRQGMFHPLSPAGQLTPAQYKWCVRCGTHFYRFEHRAVSMTSQLEEDIDLLRVFEELKSRESTSEHAAEIDTRERDGVVYGIEYSGEGFQALVNVKGAAVEQQELDRMTRLDTSVAKYLNSITSDVYLV
jgi:hypothetical protein